MDMKREKFQQEKRKTEEAKRKLETNKKKISISDKISETDIQDAYVQTAQSPKKKKYNLFLIVGTCLFAAVVLVMGYYYLFFPNVVLNGEKQVEIVYPNHYEEPGALVKQFGRELPTKPVITGEVNNEKLGNYKIVYRYEQGLFSKSTTRLVSIVDKEAPTLTLKGNNDVFACPGKTYQEEGYQASDNFDGDITDKVVVTEKDGKVLYRVEDSSGNETTLSRNVTYQDKEGPILTLKGEPTIYLLAGSPYQEAGATAIDTCEGDLSSKIEVTNPVDVETPGTYQVTYTVKDSLGNESTIKRKVVVSKNTPGNAKAGVVYLTFDDGPHGTNTTKILDVLKKYNVKATFFVTMAGPDSLILREYQEGHTVALHTASHQYQTLYRSVDAYFADLQTVSNRVKRITGEESKIIRFPGGSSNSISAKYSKGIMSTLTKEVVKRGYRYYDWNISSGDAGNTTSSQVVYQNVTKSLRKDRSNMVLMHDIKPYTAEAIERIVQYGLSNGYTFEAITFDTAMVQQKVIN